MSDWAPKSAKLIQDIEQAERLHGLKIPVTTVVGFILDALILIESRWPAGVREAATSVSAFQDGTLSVTALKKERQRCMERVDTQRGPGGWEEREVLVMELVIDAMDAQLGGRKMRISEQLYRSVAIMKVIDPSSENHLEVLLQKHFSTAGQ